ncbi:MAG: DUF4922 domain-containing protein [Cyanobacteria bacterium J06621_3]
MRPSATAAGAVWDIARRKSVMARQVPWEAGSLWQKLKAQSAHGLAVGALQSIETDITYVEDRGVRFRVYVLANLSRKEKARKQQGKTAPKNPFLPYEDDLYVCDVSSTHLCLLNKFNVVDHHFLIVTREYEPQENWLTLTDFEALAKCLREVDGLAFFNGGEVAGASQPHKHMQVVPRTSSRQEKAIDFPMEAQLITAASGHGSQLPFPSAISSLKNTPEAKALESAGYLQKTYHQLLSSVGIESDNGYRHGQTAAYNFLCTRQWMMIVPRIREKHEQISVNSLGFAGTLLVKERKQLAQLQSFGPMQLLQFVSGKPASS